MSERELRGGDSDQTVILSLNGIERVSAGGWTEDTRRRGPDPMTTDDPGAAMTSLGFIWAAIRRRGRLLLILAIVGLIGGFGMLKVKPPQYQASTTLLMADTYGTSPGAAVQNDQSLVETRTLAGIVLKRLHLNMTVQQFLGKYTAQVGVNAATQGTSKFLLISAKAPTAQLALVEAGALADELLAYQKHTIVQQEGLLIPAWHQLVFQAGQKVSSLKQQISVLRAQPQTPKVQADIANLESQRVVANNDYSELQLTTSGDVAQLKQQDEATIRFSYIVDTPALIPTSAKKRLVLYAGGGLVLGLVLGAAIAAIGALVSDRLRRRDDVARILGAPVRLSVRALRPRRWQPPDAPDGVIADPSIRQIVRHLRQQVHLSQDGPNSLAIIAVDDLKASAACAAALAVSCAKDGARVVVADLSPGSAAARLLGTKDQGVHSLTVSGAGLVVVVADGMDLPAEGPLRRARRRGREPSELDEVCQSADLLVTFMTIDPAVGADHLPEWAAGAVVFVTAGESTAARVYAIGQLIALADVTDVSAVLLRADKTDESLGVKARAPRQRKSSEAPAPPAPAPAPAPERVRPGNPAPPEQGRDERDGRAAVTATADPADRGSHRLR